MILYTYIYWRHRTILFTSYIYLEVLLVSQGALLIVISFGDYFVFGTGGGGGGAGPPIPI